MASRLRRSLARCAPLGFVLAAFLSLLASTPAVAGAAQLRAKITRTAEGIPTIEANDYRGIGFGYGYAFAEDNICTVADAYVTWRAERSRWFGPEAVNPEGIRNLDSDFFYQRLIDDRVVPELLRQEPPVGPLRGVRDIVSGYVAGYNRYLRDTGVSNLPDPRCAGEPWVRPITELDVYRLVLDGGTGIAVDGIGSAQPPEPGAPATAGVAQRGRADAGLSEAELAEVARLRPGPDGERPRGSNAWGLGGEATTNGGGMVLANPHFPWDGPLRFYQAHLVIPGKLNVSGASLFGIPLIMIGHTEKLAWSHTISTAYRAIPFELQLVDGDPTSYVVDGKRVAMRRDSVTVDVLQDDGAVVSQTRNLYSTPFGPITASIDGSDLFEWTTSTAFALFDANAENLRLLNHYFKTNHAQSTRELLGILHDYQGLPFVNTVAADSQGWALYADIGALPNVPDEKAVECASPLGEATFPEVGLPVLDGTRSACRLRAGFDAVAEGLMSPLDQPYMLRRDYVANSNDSYWLTNPEQPLEGYDRILGDERTPRSLRTRLGLKMIQERLGGLDGLRGNRFTLARLRRLAFHNRHFGGELWRDALVDYCYANPIMHGSSGPVDVREACPALGDWDLKMNLTSAGSVLFSRFMDHFGNRRFTTPFDPASPIDTPRGLDTAGGHAERALADAVTDLREAGLAMSAPLSAAQWEARGDRRIPIHGGRGSQGVFSAIAADWTPGLGYADVFAGSSFVMVTSLERGNRCPKDRSILTYSLSDNPRSEHSADQTERFSRKQWIDPPFCRHEVRERAHSVEILRGQMTKPGHEAPDHGR